MSLASAATLCLLLASLSIPTQGTPPKDKPAAPTASLGDSNIDRISKLARSYYAELDVQHPDPKKVKKALEKLIDETGKSAKAQKIADPLVNVDDWRELLRLGFTLEKPPVAVSWRGELKKVSIESPIDPKADQKALGAVFDLKLKALVSVPGDFAKVRYPVIVALHPAESEVAKGLTSMKKSKEIEDAATAWATATFSKELLSKAIVLVPILDPVQRNEDGISFSRPAWDSVAGASWAITALREIVLKSLNYDYKKIFVDGSGSGAAAAADFCTLYPGMQTGAIVRGPLPGDDKYEKFEARFENAAGTPMLFVGGTKQMVKVKAPDTGEEKEEERLVPFAKTILDKYAKVEGFSLVQKDALDDATLLGWINEHPKQFAPKAIKIRTTDLNYAASYWLRVRDDDSNLEKEPIFVDAAVDRTKNEITVVTNKKVKAFEVYLNDDVLDLSREVRILHRWVDDTAEPKEWFKGVLKRGIEDTLDNYYYRPFCNTGEVYVASKLIQLK